MGGRRARRHQSALANAAPVVHIPIGGGGAGRINSQGIRLRTEGEPQKVPTFLFPVQYNMKAKVANHFDFRDGKPQPESGRSLVYIYSVGGVTQQVVIHVIDHTCDTLVPLPPHV